MHYGTAASWYGRITCIAALLLGVIACGGGSEPSDLAGAGTQGATGEPGSGGVGPTGNQGGASSEDSTGVGTGGAGSTAGSGGSVGAGGSNPSDITSTVRGSGVAGVKPGVPSVTTPAIDFGGGKVLLAALGRTAGGGIPLGQAGDPAIVTNGLQWTWLQRACMNWTPPEEPCSVGYARRLDVWMAITPPGGLAQAQTTFTTANEQPGELHWTITEFSGVALGRGDATIAQNISTHHGTWVPHKTFTFGTPVQPGNLGVIFWIPGNGQHALQAEPGVTDLDAQVDSSYYLGHRVSTVDPTYSSSTIGHFHGADPEPTLEMCNPPDGPPAFGCAHGLIIGIELAHE